MFLYEAIRQKMKNDDRTETYRFASIWILCFGVFLCIHLCTGGSVPLLFLVFAPPVMAVIGILIIKKTGGMPQYCSAWILSSPIVS